jgi:hypothetical protein
VAEDLSGHQTLWQLRSQQRQLNILETIPATSLETLIRTQSNLSLRNKRRLALMFAYCLLKYHDSEWLASEWGKSSISFLYSSHNELDLQRPYLTSYFDTPQREITEVNVAHFHPNPSILALGILLIEIDLKRSIESFRTATEDININTDMIVANRVVKIMDQCSEPYKKAIEACLQISWMPAGHKVSLKDETVRGGLYANVVYPLERELEYLYPKS